MTDDLPIADDLAIPGADLAVATSRSGGPGGQNVNKTETRVQLSFDLDGCSVLAEGVKARLRAASPGRLTRDGRLVLACDVHRERLQNLAEVRRRLAALIRAALTPPRPRRPTRPPASAERARVEGKKRHGALKRQRGRPDEEP
jgi:ribosome-associated protein